MERHKVYFVLALTVVALFGLVSFPVRFTTESQCVLCRQTEVANRVLGIAWTKATPNEYSAWYAGNFPAHGHEWSKGATAGGTVFGNQVFCGYRSRHAILSVPPRLQLLFATNATPEELRTFYTHVQSKKREEQLIAVKMVNRALDELLEKEE